MDSCNLERIDGIDRFYIPINFWDTMACKMFWISAALSIVVIYSGTVPVPNLKQVLSILFLLSVAFQLFISLYLRLYLIPIAEGKRRKQLLSDSFGIPLTPEQTQKYYNNYLAPSIKRLGANILENTFFAKAVCGQMATKARLKVGLYLAVWLIVVFYQGTPLDLKIWVTQTVFCGDIIFGFISIELLRHKNEDLYNELYQQFLHKIDFNNNAAIACIMDAFASYESAKAVASLQQSSKIFNQLNHQLTEEWDEIRAKLGIDGIGQ